MLAGINHSTTPEQLCSWIASLEQQPEEHQEFEEGTEALISTANGIFSP